ncbi:hypothetical protein GCM10027417_25030 [Glutamicibacter endophyticus]
MSAQLMHLDIDAEDPAREPLGFGELMRIMVQPSLAVSTLYITTKGSEECTA